MASLYGPMTPCFVPSLRLMAGVENQAGGVGEGSTFILNKNIALADDDIAMETVLDGSPVAIVTGARDAALVADHGPCPLTSLVTLIVRL